MTINVDQQFEQATSNLASVFSIKSCFKVSDGAFFNRFADGSETPVPVVRHRILGTQGQIKSSGEVSNPQETESALLHPDAIALAIRFDFRLLDIDSAIHATSNKKDPSVATAQALAFNGFIERAKNSEGMKEVTRRIARTIANGSFAWRNRRDAKTMTVTVESGDNTYSFDALSISLNSFGNYSADECAVAEAIEKGLYGDRSAKLSICGLIDFGMRGSVEVYPSQAYIDNKPRGFARPLYKLKSNYAALAPSSIERENLQHHIELGQAALTRHKICNRLRTIDTWYESFEVIRKPIPIEPKGANLDLMEELRSKMDSSYAIFAKIDQVDPCSSDGMYAIAVIMRGGVFPGAGKKGKDATKEGGTKRGRKAKGVAPEAEQNVDVETDEE